MPRTFRRAPHGLGQAERLRKFPCRLGQPPWQNFDGPLHRTVVHEQGSTLSGNSECPRLDWFKNPCSAPGAVCRFLAAFSVSSRQRQKGSFLESGQRVRLGPICRTGFRGPVTGIHKLAWYMFWARGFCTRSH